MPPAAILPLDPAIPLIDVLRAAPPGEPCGVWITAGTPDPSGGCVRWGGGGTLIVSSDLGALLRIVNAVLVRHGEEVMALSSTVLALTRMLEVMSGPAPPARVALHGSPEEILSAWAAEGRRVTGSRVRYGR